MWSPGGTDVAYTRVPAYDVETVVLAGVTGSSHEIFRGEGVDELHWSPSGRYLAFVARDGLRVVDAGARRVQAIYRRSETIAGVTWAPNERSIAFEVGGEIAVLEPTSGSVTTATRGGNNEIVGWMKGRVEPGRPALRPPAVEVASGSHLRSRGAILEIASDGLRVAALVAASRVDCVHAFGWRARTSSVTRFNEARKCDDPMSVERFTALTIQGTAVAWQSFACGNYCYAGNYGADFSEPGVQSGGLSERALSDMPHEGEAAKPFKTRRQRLRGIAMFVTPDTIQLRRAGNRGTRTIRVHGSIVDAELEDVGLFYAYNVRGRYPGRIVFVPFNELFG
jgi:hypothetical protein